MRDGGGGFARRCSPACGMQAVLRLGFGTGRTRVTRVSYLGTRRGVSAQRKGDAPQRGGSAALRRTLSHGTAGYSGLHAPKSSAQGRGKHDEAHQGLGVDGGEAQWRNSGGVGAARRSLCPEIPVQCRVGVGEEEVDGAPECKAKLWRRLVVA